MRDALVLQALNDQVGRTARGFRHDHETRPPAPRPRTVGTLRAAAQRARSCVSQACARLSRIILRRVFGHSPLTFGANGQDL